MDSNFCFLVEYTPQTQLDHDSCFKQGSLTSCRACSFEAGGCTHPDNITGTNFMRFLSGFTFTSTSKAASAAEPNTRTAAEFKTIRLTSVTDPYESQMLTVGTNPLSTKMIFLFTGLSPMPCKELCSRSAFCGTQPPGLLVAYSTTTSLTKTSENRASALDLHKLIVRRAHGRIRADEAPLNVMLMIRGCIFQYSPLHISVLAL